MGEPCFSFAVFVNLRENNGHGTVDSPPKALEVEAMGQQCPWGCREGPQKSEPLKIGPTYIGNRVLGKYMMQMKDENIMGEGSYSICRAGICIETNHPVAIKVYKSDNKQGHKRTEEVKRVKFTRQIKVLQHFEKA